MLCAYEMFLTTKCYGSRANVMCHPNQCIRILIYRQLMCHKCRLFSIKIYKCVRLRCIALYTLKKF